MMDGECTDKTMEYAIVLSSATDEPGLVAEVEVDDRCVAVISEREHPPPPFPLAVEILPSAVGRKWPLFGLIAALEEAARHLTEARPDIVEGCVTQDAMLDRESDEEETTR